MNVGLHVTHRLAKVRAILSMKFDETLGDDDMGDIEREIENLKYWELPGDNLDEFACIFDDNDDEIEELK